MQDENVPQREDDKDQGITHVGSAVDSPPPGVWRPARAIAVALAKPLEQFIRIQASSGILLLLMAVLAMAWANSPWHESYHHLWHLPITLGIGEFTVERDLHFWINDGLMVIFFFVAGLEIRREMHQGELSDLRRAALPMAAAVGGMLAPAGIYLVFNQDPATHHGWGVPMATDIAFAVGILALLGKRVPSALRVLLLALAIIDDIGAILVIAFFYSAGVKLLGLAVALVGTAGVFVMQWIGIRRPLLYVVPGLVVWEGFLYAGVHPTIAGVILGLLTPVQPWLRKESFLNRAGDAIRQVVEQGEDEDAHHLVSPLERLKHASKEAIPPVIRLEAALNPWVAFGIMPLFALANAGVTVGSVDLSSGGTTILAGVALGLLIGKPVGIVSFSLLANAVGIGRLPRGMDWRGLLIVGCVGGIGFTMALFIAQLAFADPIKLGVAKLAVLLGSLGAGVFGGLLGVLLLPREPAGEVGSVSLAEAEGSTEA